jgi:hypothetical protein
VTFQARKKEVSPTWAGFFFFWAAQERRLFVLVPHLLFQLSVFVLTDLFTPFLHNAAH